MCSRNGKVPKGFTLGITGVGEMTPRALLILLPLAAASPALATQALPPPAAERVSTLTVFGNDPCPRSGKDEIVVCGRLPESERYRIPKRFRGKRDTSPAGAAWGTQVRQLEYAGRSTMPNSCSTVGSGGQTGCFHQLLQQWRAERDQIKEDAASGQ